MKVYLVGGAVRDQLLGLPTSDHDWVVVGATPEEMIKQGFKPVGKSFPVFLHSTTHEEYALARTERKQGHGYSGFIFHADKSVTLEQDLLRRDLTINAIAKDSEGRLVDPYAGQEDINKKILRHVSSSFSEDPLRVLRVARFAARLHNNGFKIAPETKQLMKDIAASGELEYLTAERVWQETEKALREPSAEIYFQVLAECQAFDILFKELSAGWQLSEKRMLLALIKAVESDNSATARFCCFCIPAFLSLSNLESTLEHEAAQRYAKSFCERLRVPLATKELLVLTIKLFHQWQYLSADANKILAFLEASDPFRRRERFDHLINYCILLEQWVYTQVNINESHPDKKQSLYKSLAVCEKVPISTLLAKGYKGKVLGDAIKAERLKLISSVLA